MNRNRWAILLLVLSVLGLSVLQYRYFTIGVGLAKNQFDRQVAEAIRDIQNGLSDRNELTYVLGNVMTGSTGGFRLSKDSLSDAGSYFMNQYLKSSLARHGVTSDFTYSIIDQKGKLRFGVPSPTKDDYAVSEFPVSLRGYLPQVTGEVLFLQLEFRDIQSYFTRQVKGLFIPGAVLILLILAISIWTFRELWLQRKVITVTSNFINNFTHELKTPVFALRLATRLLEGKNQLEQGPVLEQMRFQLGKLDQHIDRILSLGSLEERPLFDKKKIEVSTFMEALLPPLREIASGREAEFVEEIEEVKGRYIYGDLRQWEFALSNLVDNACKYNEKTPKIVTLKGWSSGSDWCISVADNGIGIPLADQRRIFDKFVRVSQDDRMEVSGYGLGLSYVKQVVKAHKSRISVESKPGEGSTFTVKIPWYDGK